MTRDTISDLDVDRKMSNAKARKILHWEPDYRVEETIIETEKSIIEKIYSNSFSQVILLILMNGT